MRSGSGPGIVALASLLPLAVAHHHHGESNFTFGVGRVTASPAALLATNSSVSVLAASEPSYFTDAAYSSLLITHVALMILAWLFILPICRATSLSFLQTSHYCGQSDMLFARCRIERLAIAIEATDTGFLLGL